jgi:opacity protein-like surface antigen
MKTLLALVVVLLLAGCSSSSADYSGQWVGTVSDTVGGVGQGNLTISQSGSQLTGSWQIGFTGGLNSGSLQGTVSGSSVSVQLYPSRPDACPYNLTATRSGDTLTGNYAAYNCSISISGTLTAQKQ